MRSLYVRLLVGFVVVLLLATAALWQVYSAISMPRVAAMVTGSQVAQAEEAAAAMQRGGPAAAAEYLRRLDAITAMPHFLTDAAGRDVVTADDRSDLTGFVPDDPAVRSPRPYLQHENDRVVFVTPSADRQFLFVTIAPVPMALSDALPYWALISAGVAALFWLLAADIVRPLRRLSAAVTSFGRGELTARAPVARPDEIGTLAAAFNEMARRLELLVTSERRLLQDVSHELRSPLTRLNLAIELLRTSPDPQPAVARLEREANRLSELVATLLEVIRLEGDPAATPMTPLDLTDVLRESADDCAVEAGTRHVAINVAGTAAPISGNRELLRRAFDNVISNAARYAPPRTTVSVCCRTTGGEHVIDVRDMGSGVREDQLSKLGTPFYRTDESRNGSTGGVGLGLAIARRAVQVHRGTLELANTEPGLQVIIRIPAER